MGADNVLLPNASSGLTRVGGGALVAYALLSFGRECLDVFVGPPPGAATELVSWMAAHAWALGTQSEILFFALMCLIPAVPVLYRRLEAPSLVLATLGCGTLAAAIPVLAMLDIVQARLVFPVYGLRASSPSVAEFAVAVYYGGLHAVDLMLGFAILMLSLAMRHAHVGGLFARTGVVAAGAAIVTGYPWLIGPTTSLTLHAGVAAWWGAVGWMLYPLDRARLDRAR